MPKPLKVVQEEEDDLALDDSKSSVSGHEEESEELQVFDLKMPCKGALGASALKNAGGEKHGGKLYREDRLEMASCVSTNEGFSSKTIPGFGGCEMDVAALAEIDVPLFA